MKRRRNGARTALATASALFAAACSITHDRAAAQTSCETAIVVGLTPRTTEAVAEVERATGARIERGAAISTDAAAFTVRAPGPETACLAVIERLRSDARVRFVEIDARRNVRQAVGR
jgi:hypothetical protein